MLDHYLEVLGRKPGALAGSTPPAAARASGVFTPVHQRFWDAADRGLGDGPGTRALVGVLLLHRTLPAAAVTAGMDAAVSLSSFDPDPVAVQARRSMITSVGSRPAVPVPATASAAASIERLLCLDELAAALATTRVYFCDPHSPWQRPSNEHTNGVLRDYFPKCTDLSVYTADDLALVQFEVNRRPRKVLGWDSPASRFATLLRTPSVLRR